MAQRVVIITGANSGLGFEAAARLAERGYDVIMACRSEERAGQAVERISRGKPYATVSYHLCDLADLSSVEAFAQWFLSTGKPLYAILNNGGVLMGDGPREKTKDGFEMSFGVNYLSHFLLTLLLLDKLKESVEVYGETRIVHVAAGWHDWKAKTRFTDAVKRPVDFDDLGLEKPGAYSWIQAYKNSKAAQVMFGKCLSRALEEKGVTSNSCSPGMVPSTDIFRARSWSARIYLYLVDNWLTRDYFNTKSMDHGVKHLVDLVDDEKFKGVSGIYYRRFMENSVSDEAGDTETQEKMWSVSCDMIKRPDFKNVLVP